MATIREIYFKTIKKKSTYLTENVVRSLLIKANRIKDDVEFSLAMDNICQNEDEYWRMVEEVESGVPYQYVINSSIFHGYDFYVDNRVLIPRNETEELVEITIRKIRQKGLNKFNLLDVCTGSGCIAISLAKEFHDSHVVATDISKDALDVAKLNNERLKTDVTFLMGNIVDPVINGVERFDVLISNPPYIKSKETVDEQVLKYEPHIALFSSPDTKFYKEMILASIILMNEGGLLAFEIDDGMETSLSDIIKKALPNSSFEFQKDMYGHTRFLFINYMEKETNNLVKAAEILRNGGIVCFPTETVMGLGVVFDNISAYLRLNEIKCRPNDKPYTMMLDSWEKVKNFAQTPDIFYEILEKCSDFPITFLLNKNRAVPGYVTHDTNVIGVRVPNHPMIRKLIQLVDKPLLVPSANKSGEKPAINSSEARMIFNDEVDYYIEGECVGGTPSTIIDLTDKEIRIIREGELTLNELKRRLKLCQK